jgi:hypothetical protein
VIPATVTAMRGFGTKTTRPDPEGGNYSRNGARFRREQSKFSDNGNGSHPAKRDGCYEFQGVRRVIVRARQFRAKILLRTIEIAFRRGRKMERAAGVSVISRERQRRQTGN